MEYRLLGPLEVRDGDRVVAIGGHKQRTLLAALLLRAGHVVSVPHLLDLLWGDDPPKTATTQVQGLVSQLRRALTPDGDGRSPLLTRHPGYLLEVAPGELDTDVFDQRVALAREDAAAGRPVRAAAGLRSALQLWRGQPLGGVDAAEITQVEVPRLEERYLAVLEERIEADLGLGRHTDLVGECHALVAEYPLRERLRGQLMLALYRSGRQAEALEVFRQGRQILGDDLGLEPGQKLRRLEEAILLADSSLDLAATVPVKTPSSPVPVPAQLPADIVDFTGRAKEVSEICDLLAAEQRDSRNASAVVVAAVSGKPGVGKTSLAVHCAHMLRAEFPDGQLYMNLRGAQAQPLAPAEVLERFLRSLGLDGGAIPDDEQARGELYRSQLAGRKMLVMLDNADREPQVRPLLPGTSGSVVLVTSRIRLAGLPGARQLELDILDSEQAVELLGRVVGPERVADLALAERIAELCGRLPLALRVAGAKLTARPHWTLARLVGRLANERHRLDELSVADIEVRASLALSYSGLDADARRTLRLLGLVEAPDFACWVPAALLDSTVERAEELVESLVEAQLLDVLGEDVTGQLRYRLHDLTKVYALECAEIEETSAQRRSALRRLCGAWLTLVDEAVARMPSGVPRVRHGNALRWRVGDELIGELLASPKEWFGVEVTGAISAVHQASQLGFDEVAWDLTASLVSAPLIVGSRFDDWQRISDVALAAARRAGNRVGEAVLLCGLSCLRYNQNRFADAEEYSARARTIFVEEGSAHGEAIAAYGLGSVWHCQGRFEEATLALEQALANFQSLDDRPAVACTRRHLGWLLYERGRYAHAMRTLGRALEENRTAGDRRGAGYVCYWIGLTQHAMREPGEGVESLGQAVDLFRQTGDRIGEAMANQAIGAIDVEHGRLAAARSRLDGCLRVFRRLHYRLGETWTRCSVAELLVAEGRVDAALEHLEWAAATWQELSMPQWRARTLRRIGDLHHARGAPAEAEAAWREGRRLFHELGSSDANELPGMVNRISSGEQA